MDEVNPDMRRKMESLVRSSFLDASYPVDDYWQIATVQRLYSLQLASAYSTKKDEMIRMGRSSDELKDKCLFICCKTDDEVRQIADHGVVVKASNFCSLGSSKKGVALYRNADVLLRASQLEVCEHCLIVVCKVMLGRTRVVSGTGAYKLDPSLTADCHSSSVTLSPSHIHATQVIHSQVYVYETSASDMLRPRQCVPLACVKYVRSQSSAVCHRGALNELRHPAVVSTSASQICSNDSVSQTSTNLTCSSADSIASGSRSSVMSAQSPPTSCVRQRQSLPSRTVLTATASQQHSQCHATDVSTSATATIGLASAVWTPMGATSQPQPQQHAVQTVQPVCYAEQHRLLAVHCRLTTSFSDEFSQNMNTILKVMERACSVLSSTVFQYTLDKIRFLKRQYCQLSGISAEYLKYQKNVRSNRSTTLPTVSCLHSSIQIMMDSVNRLVAVFREMRQWISAETRMTITERGLGLSNRFCHYLPVFVQELDNFKRSLLMIVPNTVAMPSTSNATVDPSTVSSVLSHVESSAAATGNGTGLVSSTVSPVVAQLQANENVELQGQYVEPIFVAPMPIVIQPDGQPCDDEFGLIPVKQEPVETNSRRRRSHAELIYINDSDDNFSLADGMASSINENDHVFCTLASHWCSGDSPLSVRHALNVSSPQHRSNSQLITAQSHGMSDSDSCANDAASSSAAVHYSCDVSNSINECIDSDVHADTDAGDIQAHTSGVRLSSIMPVCSNTVQSAAATFISSPCSTAYLESSLCNCTRSRSIATVADTDKGCTDQLSSFINVNYTSGAERACNVHQQLDVCPLNGDVVVNSAGDCAVGTRITSNVCLTDRLSSVTGEMNDMHGSKMIVKSSDGVDHDFKNGERSAMENEGHSVASAECCSDWSASTKLDHCLRNLSISQCTDDLNIMCNTSEPNSDIPQKQTVDAAANNISNESAPAKVPNAVSVEHNASNARCNMLNGNSDVDNMCMISSVCSIELERFDFIDTAEDTTVDDLVSAVRAFDENANIAFDKDDLCSHDFQLRNSQPCVCNPLPVKTVQQKKKKRVPASRFARRGKQKQRCRALTSIGSNICAAKCVSENVEDIDEVNSCEETLLSERDEETVDSAVVADEPVCSDKDEIQNKVVACEDTNMEETWPKSAAGVTSQLFDAAQCSESNKGVLTISQPVTEKLPLQTDVAEHTDSSSEPRSESSVSVSSKTAIDTSGFGNKCQKTTDLESAKHDSDERHLIDVIEEKCCKQPESECRDETDLLLSVPGKKKRARVIYDEEDVENEVCPTSVSVNRKSMQCNTQTSVQANNITKVRKFRYSNAESVNHKLRKKCILIEAQSIKKMKKQEQCKQQHSEKSGPVAMDKCAITKASYPKHNHTAIRQRKLMKWRKLLKPDVKQKTIHLMKGSKAHKNISIDSNDVPSSKHIHQKLPTSRTVAVGTKEKASSQSNNMTATSSKVSAAGAVPKRNQTALRNHKLKKSRKLLKLGVKQKTVHLMKGSKACKNVSIDSNDVPASKHILKRLPTSQTVAVGTKEKASFQSDNNMTAASSASVVHAGGNRDQQSQSARDKVNAIFRNSEFTRLQSNVSLVHSKRNKPVLSVSVSSSSKLADGHSKNYTSMVSPQKSRIPQIDSERDLRKSVVTSGYLTGTAVTSSAVHFPYKARRPEESFSVRTSTSIAHSDAPLKAKSGQRNRVDSSHVSQKIVKDTSKLSSASSIPVVCAGAVNHSFQNQIPSLMSLKVKPCCTKVTTDVVSSVNCSITGSQSLNSGSTSTLRDPRLAQRSSDQQLTFGLNEYVTATNLATSTVDMNRAQNLCGSMQWPWEQTHSAGIQTKGSTNFGLKGDERNEPSSCVHSTAGCWMWELGTSTCSSSSHSSTLNVNVGDILADLNTSSSSVNYLQTSGESSQWHSASRVFHNGSLVSPPLHTAGDDYRASDVANSTLPSDAKSLTEKCYKSIDNRKTEGRCAVKQDLTVPHVERFPVSVESHADEIVTSLENSYDSEAKGSSMRVSVDIMSPVAEHDSQQHVGDISVPAWHISPAGNAHNNQASDATKSLPHNNNPRWRLIPLDSTGILHVHNSVEKPLCERQRCSHPSDPRLKATSQSVSNILQTDKSGISGSTYWSNDTDCQPIVASWDTDSLSDVQQTKPMGELDCSQSGTSVPAAESLDRRIGVFISHMDSFSINKNVEDKVDKMMSLWKTDSDDAEMCLNSSVRSGDLQQHLEVNGSDVDHFIVIDDDDIDRHTAHIVIDDDDDSDDGLVIDLNGSDVELMPEPGYNQSVDDGSPFTKTLSGHTIKQDVTRNIENNSITETKIDHKHSTLSDNYMQPIVKAEEHFHVDNPLDRRHEHCISTRNVYRASCVANSTLPSDAKSLTEKCYKSIDYRKTEGRCAVKQGLTVPHVERLPVSVESRAVHRNKCVKHRSVTHELVKQSASARRGSAASESRKERSADTRQRNTRNDFKLSKNSGAGTKKEIYRSVSANSSTRTRHKVSASKVSMSSNTAKQRRENLVKNNAASSHGKPYKTTPASASATCFDSASTVSACVSCLADISDPELSKLKQHMESRVKALEKKVTQKYACSLNNLSESEKQQLVADRIAEPAVVGEFSLELRLQVVQRQINMVEAEMAEVKSKFDPTRPSMSLEKKYDQCERKCNRLLVRRDWFYIRMNRLRRYHKSNCLLTLPDDLRFSSEYGKCVSVEGIPLILNECTIALHHCTRLASLLMLIKSLHSNPVTPLPRDVLQKLGWLHQERRTLLSEVCCSSAQKVSSSVECLSEKLTVYKNATMYFDGKRDTQSRHLKTFAADVANKLRHCIYALEHLEQSSDGAWYLPEMRTTGPRSSGCQGVKQSPVAVAAAVANKHEQAKKQKRKQILETLSDIVQKKRRSLDANEPEASNRFLAADDAVSAVPSWIPESSLTSCSSTSDKNLKSRENWVKNVVEEPDLRDVVDLPSLKESSVESLRNSSSASNFKQSSDHAVENHERGKPEKKLPPVLGSCPSASEHHSSKRISSGEVNTLLGPAREADNNDELGGVVDAAVQHIGKTAVLSGCEVENSNDEPNNDFSGKPNKRQFDVQKVEHRSQDLLIPEHESEAIQTDVEKPLSVTMTEPECFNDEVDPFAFSPPRKVRLKFKDGSSKPCADTTGQRTSTVTVTSSHTAPCKNSYPRSSDFKPRQQLSEDSDKDYRHCKQDNRPPLLGHSPTVSKRCVRPLMPQSARRKPAGNVRNLLEPYQSSVTENECHVSKKPLLHLDAQNREYIEPDRNNYHRSRGQRTYPRSPPTGFTGGQWKRVADRSEWLNGGRDVLQDQCTSRFERENEFKNELWRQRREEAAWQERERAVKREEDQWFEREYSNRCDVPLQQDRVSDLREKLNNRYRYSNPQHVDEDYSFRREAHRPVLFDDRQISHIDDDRRCLLRAPPHQFPCESNEDESHVVDDLRYVTRRRRNSPLLGDYPDRLCDNSFLQDGDSWMNVDRRDWKQSRQYSNSSFQREPDRDWIREDQWRYARWSQDRTSGIADTERLRDVDWRR